MKSLVMITSISAGDMLRSKCESVVMKYNKYISNSNFDIISAKGTMDYVLSAYRKLIDIVKLTEKYDIVYKHYLRGKDDILSHIQKISDPIFDLDPTILEDIEQDIKRRKEYILALLAELQEYIKKILNLRSGTVKGTISVTEEGSEPMANYLIVKTDMDVKREIEKTLLQYVFAVIQAYNGAIYGQENHKRVTERILELLSDYERYLSSIDEHINYVIQPLANSSKWLMEELDTLKEGNESQHVYSKLKELIIAQLSMQISFIIQHPKKGKMIRQSEILLSVREDIPMKMITFGETQRPEVYIGYK